MRQDDLWDAGMSGRGDRSCAAVVYGGSDTRKDRAVRGRLDGNTVSDDLTLAVPIGFASFALAVYSRGPANGLRRGYGDPPKL